jgi:hypothetical protein
MGVWSQASDHDKTVKKTDVVRAEIHTQPIGGNGVIDRAYSCPGDEFKEFQWIAQVRQQFGATGPGMSSQPEIIGLSINRKDGGKITFYKDGSLIKG